MLVVQGRGARVMIQNGGRREEAPTARPHVVILTALDVEYAAVRAHLEGLRTVEGPAGSRYEVGTFTGRSGRLSVAVQWTGPGNSRAAVEAERAIVFFRPKMVFFVGVAGGRKDVALGDVVAADEIYDYETGKDTGEGFLPRFKTHQSSHRLIQAARLVATSRDWHARIRRESDSAEAPRARIAPLAAGGRVIADKASDAAVRLSRNAGDALAVEMEGYGFLFSAHVNQHVEALVVRGISDLLEDKGEEGHDAFWQPAASANAAAFAYEVISETGLREDTRSGGHGGDRTARRPPKLRPSAGGEEADGRTGQSGEDPPPAGPDEGRGRFSVLPPFGRRDSELRGRADLVDSIMSSTGSKVQVLAGLGGSGKSRIALEAAHLARQAGRQVWWISVPQINASMREVANQLGAPGNRVERAWRGAGSATDLVWQLLEAAPQPWLLVFDNADDPQRLAPLDGPVSDGTGWLRAPRSGRGKVIVTSRDRQEATWGAWCQVYPVLPLEPHDGASMLTDRMEAGGTHEEARRLSSELGGLPLALRAAADYLKTVTSAKISFGDQRITDFESYRAAVKRSFESPPSPDSRDLNESLGLEIVEGVFDLSLELLARRGFTQAAPLLKAFACLSIAPIPHRLLLDSDELAASGLFPEFREARGVLNALADLGFIEPHSSGYVDDPDLSHVLSLHPLVHGILRNDRDVQQRRSDYYGLNARLLLAATNDHNPDLPESGKVWNLAAPHAMEVARAILAGAKLTSDTAVHDSAFELARLTSRYLIEAGLLKPAQDLLIPIIGNRASLGIREDDRRVLALRHERGRLHMASGSPQIAEEELRDVIEARTRVLGEWDADTLASGHKLAKAVLDQGRWREAEQLLSDIVRAENEVRGPQHPDTLVVRHSLARSVLAQQRSAEAELILRDILDVRSRISSSMPSETLLVRQTLARSLLKQGKTAEAEVEVSEALRDCRGRWDSPAAMWLRFALSEVLLMQGQVSEATAVLKALVKDRSRVLGDAHPETVRTRHLLARTQDELPSNHSGPEGASVS